MLNNSIYRAVTYLLLFLIVIVGFVLIYNRYYYGTWVLHEQEKTITTIEEFESEGTLIDDET